MQRSQRSDEPQICYVWVRNKEKDKPVLAGRVVSFVGRGASFMYAKSYLNNKDSYPLDPIHLPLKPGKHTTSNPSGMFSCLSDAGPGDWGRKVLDTLIDDFGPPETEVDYLLRGSGEGVGRILFSTSAEEIKVPRRRNSVRTLEEIQEAACEIFAKREPRNVSPEVKYALKRGVGMHGARPKVFIDDHEGKRWIAKLNTKEDEFDVAQVEHAAMSLARDAGMRVPETQVVHIGPRPALLVERFDIDRKGELNHVVSAMTLLDSGDQVNGGLGLEALSYPGIAALVPSLSRQNVQQADREEIFRRAAFAVATGVTDDHLRNHSFLYNEEDGFRLSPAYDVLPSPDRPGMHAIGLTPGKHESTPENLLQAAEQIGIEAEHAKSIMAQVAHPLVDWKAAFKKYGVSEADIETIAPSMMNVEEMVAYIGKGRANQNEITITNAPE